jgi:release factor glutamine methyltransferase
LISNPPYVTESEYVDLDIELSFEPKAALVAPPSSTGVDGLGDLEAIINGALPYLANQAVVVFECAPEQAKALRELSMTLGSAEIIMDLAGRERGVLVRRAP